MTIIVTPILSLRPLSKAYYTRFLITTRPILHLSMVLLSITHSIILHNILQKLVT